MKITIPLGKTLLYGILLKFIYVAEHYCPQKKKKNGGGGGRYFASEFITMLLLPYCIIMIELLLYTHSYNTGRHKREADCRIN